ncbi:hypothetical protein RJT34_31063 [Clitoria ternatea]|uniref:Uncharacterized protein n=1 Tax=Clitoria ternatea TaxID=43366 RepID=A0AAN9ETZ6_CLITE
MKPVAKSVDDLLLSYKINAFLKLLKVTITLKPKEARKVAEQMKAGLHNAALEILCVELALSSLEKVGSLKLLAPYKYPSLHSFIAIIKPFLHIYTHILKLVHIPIHPHPPPCCNSKRPLLDAVALLQPSAK